MKEYCHQDTKTQKKNILFIKKFLCLRVLVANKRIWSEYEFV
jgi:hypothetical protein